MALEDYRNKRRFNKTPEPDGSSETAGGASSNKGSDGGLLYAIQKHAARNLHYDFRLELDGVLLSWAVPKGPSLDPKDRRLAARTEDHPLEYGDFEGIIPEGEYGAGTVQLWDQGTWEPEGDPHDGLKRGDLKFALQGEKLRGGWVLVRMKPRPGEGDRENWLLIKHRDDKAVDGDGQAILRDQDRSVSSGRTLEEITTAAPTAADPAEDADTDPPDAASGEDALPVNASAVPGARKVEKMPDFVPPQAATLVEEAPEGGEWLHEVKFDGYRILARVEDGGVTLRSRNDKDWTERFGVLADDLARLPVKAALFDGEVVVQLSDGTTSFQGLQNALGSKGGPRGPRGAAADESAAAGRLLYYVFDLLHLDGYELLAVPLEERKRLLQQVVTQSSSGSRIRYSEHVAGQGPALLQEACEQGLEGVVSKKADAVYRPGRRGEGWLKSKCRMEQEFVVGGFTDPSGGREGFGALLLGVNEGGRLRYVSKVGTGFDQQTLRELGGRLGEMVVEETPFALDDRLPEDAHWVRPELVAQVVFSEWTDDGALRHPSFKGLRGDKAASDVVAETPAADPRDTGPAVDDVVDEITDPSEASTPESSGSPSDSIRDEAQGIEITHLEKILWPRSGLTKRDLVHHYQSVAEWMLPHVVGRPIAMVRCPDGIEDTGKACFYHKHPGDAFPGPFERVSIEESDGPGDYLTITGADSLAGLAQMGVLEIHVWGSTWPAIERPDMVVFDLDPDPAVDWDALVDAARLTRDVLRALGLQSFVKTTGGKGLHVQAPVVPAEEWDAVHAFCKAVAEAVVAHAPDRYTATMSKAKRRGKIYVDWVRNTRGATSIAPYSTRAREQATVAVPLRWDELRPDLRPDSYTMENIARRLGQLKGDPWEGWEEAGRNQTLRAAMDKVADLAH